MADAKHNDPRYPEPVCQVRVRTTNSFTGEILDYSIDLPKEVAYQYNHAVNVGIAAVLAKAGEILTDVSLGGEPPGRVQAKGEEMIAAIQAVKI